MKNFYLLFHFLTGLAFTTQAQVPDSTFGVPYSFYGSPGAYAPGVTGCDFGGRHDQAFGMLTLDDGRLLLAGYTRGGDGNDFALVRLLPDGQFDETAGEDGEIRLDLGFDNDSCLAAARYGPEKILMAGCVTLPAATRYSGLVVCTDPDGRLDTLFGDHGKATFDLPGALVMITEIRPLPDGKIVVGGNAYYNTSPYPDSAKIFVGRLLSNGQVDSSFGVNGFVYRQYEPFCKASLMGDLVMDGSGRIIVSGASYSPYPGGYDIDPGCSHNIHIFRFLPDGQPDLSFGVGGLVRLPQSKGRATALYAEADGKVLVAGVVSKFLLLPPDHVFLTRLLPDGQPDTVFADQGRFVWHNSSGFGGGLEPVGICQLNDNIILGTVEDPEWDHPTFGALCFSGSGTLNPSFGQNGFFSSFNVYQWMSYYIKHISVSPDSQSIFISGYYRLLGQNNMMICKIKLPALWVSAAPVVSTPLKVYPNPVGGGIFYLELPEGEPAKGLSFAIFDVCGRETGVDGTVLPDGRVEIRTGGLPAGVYVVEAWGISKRYAGRLIVL